MRLGPAALARTLSAAVAGFVGGALVVLSTTTPAVETGPTSPPTPEASASAFEPATLPEASATFLAWTPGGLVVDFEQRASQLRGIERITLVASGMAWLDRSSTLRERRSTAPPRGWPSRWRSPPWTRSYADFLPPADRGVTVALADGRAVLGASEAAFRGLGPGSRLVFGEVHLQVAAVIADELLGAHEVLVSKTVGHRLGVRVDRYALIQPAGGLRGHLRERLARVLPPGTLLQVRAPGETPYFRMGDAVLPLIRLKEVFGEFAGRPTASGYVETDPRWVREHIVEARVPLLGVVHCHRAILWQLRGALREVERLGLGSLVHQYGGCYASRTINRVPGAALSHHAWGVAIDVNVPENPFGHPPSQDTTVVRVFEDWGFTWGGNWMLPDGMHFEFLRFPERG